MQKTIITIESARGDILYYELHAVEKIYTPVFFLYFQFRIYRDYTLQFLAISFCNSMEIWHKL